MEEQRLAATRDLELFDTEPEAEFDELVRLAAKVCGTPMSMITLLDEHRQWFKARHGVSVTESRRDTAFCDHAIRGSDVFVVEDASHHPLFQDNPFVLKQEGWRFYAGMPISGREGLKVGTLCVLDYVPRRLSEDQCSTLRILGRQVSAHMELRLQRRELRKALEERTSFLAELSAREQLFRTFMHYSPMASFIKDAKGRYVYYNQKLADSAGIALESAIGLTDMELWPPDVARELRASDDLALAAGTVLESDERTVSDGKKTEWRCFKFPWQTAVGEQMLAGIALDVTAERRDQAQLRHYQAQLEELNRRLTLSANTDPLTGLANRRALDEGVQAAEGTPVLPGFEIAVLTIDIDHFKQVNDTLGHAYGDAALQHIAFAIARCTRDQDLVARSGGEEFIVLLPAGGKSTAIAVGQRVLEEVRNIHWQPHSITVSVGIATTAKYEFGLSGVLARSDRALYMAKQQGRDRLVYLSADDTGDHDSSLHTESCGRAEAHTPSLKRSF